MPPSSDHDAPSTSNVSPSPPKSKSKQTAGGGGASKASKAARKNGSAQESGITQAVKSSTSKMPSKQSPPTAISRYQTPDLKPAAQNGGPITSPLLDAISSATFNSSAQNTTEWARNVQTISGSPSNLINLGESPPVLPSSYPESNHGGSWNGREYQYHSPPSQITSVSPPTGPRQRPLSFQMESRPGFSDGSAVKTGGIRRGSVYSPPSHGFGFNPPLPHQPQPHFYGAPNFGLPIPSSGLIAGSEGYHCGFDSLVTQCDGQCESQSVVLTGYRGGLDVFSVSKHGLEKLYSLPSLRGGVYSAKVLGPAFASSTSPLVVVIVHGPVVRPSKVEDDNDIHSPPELATGSVRGSPQGASPANDNPLNTIAFYQTTVEVYSLKTKEHITTLLALPAVPLTTPIMSPLFKHPPPSGALSLRSSGKAVVIASGTTGETWIYRLRNIESQPREFECVGKIWTSIQYGLIGDTGSSASSVDGENPLNDSKISQQQPKSALVSLNNRWLAYCPPPASSQHSLRATVPGIAPGTKVPGLNAFAPPHTPSVNCGTDIPQGESLLNKVAREGLQEVIKGAKWVGDQGMQAFKNYWNKPASGQTAALQTASSPSGQFWQGNPQVDSNPHHFPPTHGTGQQGSTASEPMLVSIIDIERLVSHTSASPSAVPHPLVTFKAPLGCSFLSFAPTGLMLFTASSKGDVQFVWDLMRLQYTRSSLLQAQPQNGATLSPHVRQIASYTRITPAKIVDVVWTEPHGKKLAFVSERGTVHVLDLPDSAFAWPPPRRKVLSSPTGDIASSRNATESTASAAGAAMNAVSSAFRSSISRPRRSSGAGIGALRATSMTAHAGYGSKVLAAGVSKSFGAATGTFDHLRNYGENRVHLPQNSLVPNAGCVRWLKGKRRDTIAVVGNGVVRIHTLKQRRPSVTVDRLRGHTGARYLDHRLPNLPNSGITPTIPLELEDGFDLNENDTDNTKWRGNHDLVPERSAQTGSESSIPQAEIESNAPYQPFHTDRRVGLYVYASPTSAAQDPTISALLAPKARRKAEKLEKTERAAPRTPSEVDPWAFGLPISMTKLDLGIPDAAEDQDAITDDHRALPPSAIERVLTYADNDGHGEQIVVTTRRRKLGSHPVNGEGLIDDEGFFEDDCEVLDFASQRV